MPVETRNVYSSHVNTVAYNDETAELLVTWDTGKTSVYSGVPYEKFDSATHSWSVGKYLHEHIKPVHPHRYA